MLKLNETYQKFPLLHNFHSEVNFKDWNHRVHTSNIFLGSLYQCYEKHVLLKDATSRHQESMSVKFMSTYTPLLYRKTGVCKGLPYFLNFDPKHTLWVLVKPPRIVLYNSENKDSSRVKYPDPKTFSCLSHWDKIKMYGLSTNF